MRKMIPPPSFSGSRRAKFQMTGVAVACLAAGYVGGHLTAPPHDPQTAAAPAAKAPPRHEATAEAVSEPSPGLPTTDDTEETLRDLKAAKRQAAASWEARRAKLQGQAASGARERGLADLLREQAAHDPEGAMRLAGQETNARFKRELINTALGGWASAAPRGAVEWAAAHLNDDERGAAIKNIVDAGMDHREETIAAIGELCRANSQVASDYGRVLIEALGRGDHFKESLDFAAQGTGDNRNYWYSTALFSMAQYRPQEAVATLAQMSDPGVRNEAMHGMVYGWASNDPAGLLDYALTMPPGDVRKTALNEAWQHWVTNDPEAASTWMAAHPPSADLDSGAAKVATDPALVASQTDVALGWATSIVDPKQRSIALIDIIQQWASRDPKAAIAYAQSTANLTAEVRTRLLAELTTPPSQTSAP